MRVAPPVWDNRAAGRDRAVDREEAGMSTCRWGWVGIFGVGVVVGAACQPASPPEPAADAIVETHDWTYDGETGPEHWGQLNSDFSTCGTGVEQSPIDLAAPAGATTAAITFDYRDSALELVNNGHTIQATYDAGSTIEIDGERYELEQFHLHGPSEHTLGGREYALEIHFVHRSAGGQLAVVGALAEVGPRHAGLAPVFDNLPTEPDLPRAVLEARVAADLILPRDRTAFVYAGSLTTPPCTEGVRWIVLQHPVTVDEQQLEQYHAVMHRNDRPVQPLNGRMVTSGVS